MPTIAVGGTDVVEGPGGWDSRSVYFLGPGGMLCEYIARENHRGATPGHRSGSGPALLGISEVAIGVSDVPTVVAALLAQTGLPAFPPRNRGSPRSVTTTDC